MKLPMKPDVRRRLWRLIPLLAGLAVVQVWLKSWYTAGLLAAGAMALLFVLTVIRRNPDA
jgi:hypothetical protein